MSNEDDIYEWKEAINENIIRSKKTEQQLKEHLDHFHGDQHYQHHKKIVDILKQLLTRMEYVSRKYPNPYDAFDKNLSADFYLKLKNQLEKSASGFNIINIREDRLPTIEEALKDAEELERSIREGDYWKNEKTEKK